MAQSMIENRVSSIELRGTVNLHLSGTVICETGLFKNYYCASSFTYEKCLEESEEISLHIVTVFEELVLQNTDLRIDKFFTSAILFLVSHRGI